jgi:hypothetical protein
MTDIETLDSDVILNAIRTSIENGETAQLAELVTQLDTLLKQGGRKPKDWLDAGVNLDMDPGFPQILALATDLGSFLASHQPLAIRTFEPALIVAQPLVGQGEGYIACLAVRATYAKSPLEALEELTTTLHEDVTASKATP